MTANWWPFNYFRRAECTVLSHLPGDNRECFVRELYIEMWKIPFVFHFELSYSGRVWRDACSGMFQDFLRKFVQLNPSNPAIHGRWWKSQVKWMPRRIIPKLQPQSNEGFVGHLVFVTCVKNEETIPINSNCSHWCCSAQLIPKTLRTTGSSVLMWNYYRKRNRIPTLWGATFPATKLLQKALPPQQPSAEWGLNKAEKCGRCWFFFSSPLMKLKPAS